MSLDSLCLIFAASLWIVAAADRGLWLHLNCLYVQYAYLYILLLTIPLSSQVSLLLPSSLSVFFFCINTSADCRLCSGLLSYRKYHERKKKQWRQLRRGIHFLGMTTRWNCFRVFLPHMHITAGGSLHRLVPNSIKSSALFWGEVEQHTDSGAGSYHHKLSWHLRWRLLCVCLRFKTL